MKNCEEIRKRLSAFIDNELSSQERALIKRHLEGCPYCAKEASSLRILNDLLDSIPDEGPAPSFVLQTVHSAGSWMQCDYVKEHFFRPAVAYMLSVVSLLLYFEAGGAKRAYPAYRHLRTFDDFPPESFSSIYLGLIQEERK